MSAPKTNLITHIYNPASFLSDMLSDICKSYHSMFTILMFWSVSCPGMGVPHISWPVAASRIRHAVRSSDYWDVTVIWYKQDEL